MFDFYNLSVFLNIACLRVFVSSAASVGGKEMGKKKTQQNLSLSPLATAVW